MLSKKTIVLGVTGSIAVYKAVDLASKLTQAEAGVMVIMTDSATKFVTPLTFRNITGHPVTTGMWDLASEFSVQHVALAEAADVVVIAPATANIIAKIAAGIADDMLTCTVLATKAPVIVVPAMNDNMYANQVTRGNIEKLVKRGFIFMEPEFGRLASGKTGKGRYPDTDKIFSLVNTVLNPNLDFNGKKFVISAGGTQEPIDPVRFIGNRSSGKMGYAIAEAARDRGGIVTLISGPVSLPEPSGMEIIRVNTASEMKKAVNQAVKHADILVMAAAVADFQPVQTARQKIKKKSSLTLELKKTDDILGEVKGDFIKVGFAAESENLVKNAREKLKNKNLDLIVCNDITAADSGFGADTNKVVIIDRDGKETDLPLMPKRQVAEKILDRIKTIKRWMV